MEDTGSILGYASLPVLLAVLVAVPFAGRDRSGTTAPLPAAEGGSTDPQEDAGVGGGAFRKGRDLLGEVMGGPCCTRGQREDLRVLIASLPDPDESSLDWNYDASLSAIRRALEAARYTSDRSWFPPPDSSVTVDRDGTSRTLPVSRAEPGVLVFRGSEGASTRDLAVVYVVGEVPTTGIHKEALRTALDEARALTPDDTLRVLGPSFSGSIPSLRAVLETLPGAYAGHHLRVVSGSATATRNRSLLTDGLATTLAGVTFGTTVRTDDAYTSALEREILRPLRIEGHEVALLTESNTGYGAAMNPAEADSGAAPADQAGAPDRDGDPYSLDDALVVTFPLNIAALRAEYDRNPGDTVGRGFRLPGRSSRIPLSLQLRSRPLEVPPARSRLTAPTLDITLADVLRTLQNHRIRAVGILASDVRDKIFLAGMVRRELPDALLFTFEGNSLFLRPELSRDLRGMVVVSTYPLILENAVWTESERILSFPADPVVGVFNATLHLLRAEELAYQYRPPGADPADPAPRPPVWITTVASGSFQPLAVHVPADDPETGRSTPLPGVPGSGAGSEGSQGMQDRHDEGHAHPFGILSVVSGLTVLVTGGVLLLALIFALVPPAGGSGAGRAGMGEDARPGEEGGSGRPSGWSRVRAAIRGLLRDVILPAAEPGLPGDDPGHRGWRTLDFLSVSVALLAVVAPLAYLNGVPAPWESEHHPVDAVLGLPSVLLLAAYTLLLVAWVARSMKRRWTASLSLLLDHQPHAMAALLGALGLLYWFQLAGLRGAGSDMQGVAESSVAFGLYQYRTLQLEAATSGLLLFLMASLGVVVAVVWHRNRRHVLWTDRRPLEDLPSPSDSRETGSKARGHDDPWERAGVQLATAMDRIRRALGARFEPPLVVTVLLVLAAPLFAALLLWWPDAFALESPHLPLPNVRTLDDVALDRGGWAATTRVLWAGLLLGFGVTLASAVHLYLVWRPMRTFLHTLSGLPVAPALGRIPARLRTLGRLHLFDPPAENLGTAQAETGHEAVWKTARRSLGTTQPGEEREDDDGGAPPDAALRKVLAGEEIPDVAGLDSRKTRARSLSTLIRVLRRAWSEHPELVLLGAESGQGAGEPSALERWVRDAELVVALEVTRYVGWVLSNLRRICLIMLFSILWTTAYLEVMPFPHHAVMTAIFIALATLGVGGVIGVMAYLSQDDVISRINGSPPGKITWRSSSLLSAMAFVMIPVLGLLSTEVEPVGRIFFGWIGDILRVLSVG